MTPEQFTQLLSAITAQKLYTLTGAADWPMMAAVGGFFWAIIIGLGGVMWFDLRNSLSAGEQRWQKAVDAHAIDLDKKCLENKVHIEKHEEKVEKRFDSVFELMEKCQADCCPRHK